MIDIEVLLARVWSSGPSILAVIVGAWATGTLFQWQPGTEYALAAFLLLAAIMELLGRRLARGRRRDG